MFTYKDAIVNQAWMRGWI